MLERIVPKYAKIKKTINVEEIENDGEVMEEDD